MDDALYLVDYTDREGIDTRTGEKEGFQCLAIVETKGLSKEQINDLKEDLENGNIRNSRDVDSWIKKHRGKQGHYSSDSSYAKVARSANDDVRLDSETRERESGRGFSDKSDSANSERGRISDELSLFTTPNGEIFGFATPEGEIYVDETKINPEHPMHEYAHVWTQVVNKTDPKLWSRGVELAKETSLWKEIADSDAYGKKWKQMVAEGKMTQRQWTTRT